jgi:cell division protein FtsZ
VTVIATGFTDAPAQKVLAAEPAAARREPGEVIPYEEWASMGRSAATSRRTVAEDFLLGRNSREADLSVPTILREKRAAGQKD